MLNSIFELLNYIFIGSPGSGKAMLANAFQLLFLHSIYMRNWKPPRFTLLLESLVPMPI
jgi:hypothetical protein